MKIAFAATVAIGLLLGRPSGASSHAGAAGKNEVEGKEEHGLDGSVQNRDERQLASAAGAALGLAAPEAESGGGVRGSSSRSLACAPTFGNATLPFIDRPGYAYRTMGFGPIGNDMKLMPSNFIGNPRTFFTYATKPFYICNTQLQSLLPGLAGYTLRAYVLFGSCAPESYYVLLKLYDPVNKKVVKRQKEMSSPFVLYGNEVPFANVSDIKYGSVLLPNGVYEASAILYLADGTVADTTSLGTQIVVVSC
jgi:hypothetical protein